MPFRQGGIKYRKENATVWMSGDNDALMALNGDCLRDLIYFVNFDLTILYSFKTDEH